MSGSVPLTMNTPPDISSSKAPTLIWTRRAWNIAFRTAHLGVAGAVFGGHVFGVERDRILVWLYLTVATGIALTVIEAYPRLRWCYQGRGVMVLLKVALLCFIPWFWEYRVSILVVVIVLASVGSHMPGRFRYYSLVHRRVLD